MADVAPSRTVRIMRSTTDRTGAHVVLVDGSRGISRAAGREFAAAGARVTLAASEPGRLARAAEGIGGGTSDRARARSRRGVSADSRPGAEQFGFVPVPRHIL